MADIQLLQSNRISERVPGANVANEGATASAIGQVGGKLEQFATDLAMKRKAVEVKDYVLNSKMEFEREYEAMVAEQRKSWGADHKGFTEYIKATGRDMKQKYLDNAPYQDAKDAFNLEADEHVGMSLIKQDSELRRESTDLAKDSKKKYALHKAQQFQADPLSPTRLVDFADTLEEMNDPDLFTPEEIVQNQNMARKAMRDGTLNGYLSKAKEMGTNGQMVKERDFYKKGIDFLRSGDPMLSDMTPDDMLAYENQFEQGLRQAKERSSRHTRDRVNAFIISGGADPALYSDIKSRIMADPNLDSFDKQDYLAKVTSQHVYNQVSKVVGLVPPNERDINGVVEKTIANMSITDPYVKAATSAKLKNEILERTQQDDKEVLKDGGAYFEVRDPAVHALAVAAMSGDRESYQKYKVEMDAHYDRFQIAPGARSYTTPSMRNHFKKSFEGALDNREYQSATQALEDIVEMAGPDTYRVMKESGINPKYAVVGTIPDPLTRTRMLQNMETYNKESPALKAVGEKKVNDIRVEWNNTKFIKAVRANGTPASKELADAMVDQMEYDFASRVTKGESVADAKQKAVNLFNNHYATTKVSRSTVYYPQGDQVLKSSVDQFLNAFTNEDIDYVGALGLKIDGDTGIANADIRDSGQWVNVSPNEVELQVRDGTGVLRTLEKKDGKPARWTMEEIKAFPVTKVMGEQRRAQAAKAPGKKMLQQARQADAINKGEMRKFFKNLFGGDG